MERTSGILLNCLLNSEADKILGEFHAGDCGGHLYWKSTVDKILRAGFYWPSLFADVYITIKSFQKCQFFAENIMLSLLPLLHVFIEEPFRHWALDFIGEINP